MTQVHPRATGGAATPVTSAELDLRTIRSSEYVSCNTAFIDCRMPGSDLKENYSIIGAGVTQNPDQIVNLQEPHGFNVGAAAMPAGVTNNLHLHFTAEVFLNFRGKWLLRWGADGTDGELPMGPGDIVTVPTWIFRGFTNVGEEHGWLFTALGFDVTGGIIWGPSIVTGAREQGLYLSADNQLIDTQAGDVVTPETELIEPMPQDEIAKLRHWSVEQMRSRVVTQDDLDWSAHPFLCTELPGGGAQLALVVGYGMTEDRDQVPPVHYPHNFNLSWLRADTGEGMLTHRHDATQAVIVYQGRWRVTVNTGDQEVATEIGPEDTLSVPAGAWRRFEVVSDEPGQLAVINGGDGRVHLEWGDEVRWYAKEKGWAQDAAGYVAPWSVVRTSVLDD
ncbi:cupin domain-containing protein [Nakamurella endophytica]|uniref:Cupin n=1 Tax=Nakamurella endophytica TaxID=1748367 RepID=A0A917WHQ7_9ACTN|nr:cupin domain-containing protein [Nakamurella endophytica]GGM04993.1 cupin [Nakamurella endophytica]